MLSTVANAVCQLLLKHVMNAFQADEVFGCMANTCVYVCILISAFRWGALVEDWLHQPMVGQV